MGFKPNGQPTKRRTLLNLRRPFLNHNGVNTLNFSPETGKLVLTTGDGGSGYDPFNLSQNNIEICGKIIEIDVTKNTSVNNPPVVTRFDEPPISIQETLTVMAKGVEVWVYDEKSKVYNLAKNICTNLSKDINTPNRGVKISKNFSVLRKTKMPSILIEIDFISNSTVENSLKDDTYIKTIANSISNSLLAFVNKPIVDDNFSYCVCIDKFKDKDTALY